MPERRAKPLSARPARRKVTGGKPATRTGLRRATRAATGSDGRSRVASARRASASRALEARAIAKRSRERAPLEREVRVLFLDVDGTLTDGVIAFDSDGRDSRNFWIRDGIALEWARKHGVLPVVISGRASDAVIARMKDLGLEHYVGAKDKVVLAERVLAREGVDWSACVMIGDDLPDVPLMRRVAWPIAVADARPEVLAVAKTVTDARAGFGAVREAVEAILRHNGVWEQVLEAYEAG